MHSMKNDLPISQNSPNGLEKWFFAARPKTWIAGVSPVLIGASMAPLISWGVLFLTLLFSLLIQIGTNFANDYFDFMKGADTEERKGPKRAVQQGWISPSSMKRGTFLIFIFAFLTAIPLMAIAGLWSLPLAILSIGFGLLYTGGPKPLGYLGLGEIFVFFFFGPVATCGTYFLQTNLLCEEVLLASIAPGLFSCALLIANNLRDEETDRKANKKTLVVRFGSLFGKIEYAFAIGLPLFVPLILVLFYKAPINLLGPFFLFPILFKSEISLSKTSLLFFSYTLLFVLSFIW
jgi:1,4-dihydroxy-2-naphthoate octaprenyltransferase